MKNIKKITKILLAIIIALVATFTSVSTVNAEERSISLGNAPTTKSYIAGFNFSYKMTTDGRYLYCLNYHKSTARNITANIVDNSNNIDGGMVYIIKNGYPYKSITGDNDKDYYITQVAVWWYLDETHSTSNLTNSVKSTGSDSYGLRQYAKNLVEEAKKHKNDSLTAKDTKLAIATSDSSMTLSDSYFISNEIKATQISNLSSYTVSLTNAPSGTIIVKNGTDTKYSNAFTVNANESFKVKVPASAVTGTELSISVNASAKANTFYTAHEYQPTNTSMQNVALLEIIEGASVSSALQLNIATSKVTVTKIDSITKEPIAGAKLVLKDAKGKVVTSWTSEINARVITNLPNGKYTIIEDSAPTGYLVNKTPTEFTISDTNKNIAVKIEDAPKKVVVNITKIDQETKAPLAGATLVVKKADGTEVKRFETTTTSYTLTDLENGTYYVEEESAPTGYIKSDRTVEFTIDDEHLSHQIIFENAKEVFVPNTSSVSSIIMLILGIGITGLGIRFIYKNGKKA